MLKMMAGVGCEPTPAHTYLAARSFRTAAAAVGARVSNPGKSCPRGPRAGRWYSD